MQNLLHGSVTNHQGQSIYQTFFSGIAVCEKFVEDFQGDFYSITFVSKEYSEFSQKTMSGVVFGCFRGNLMRSLLTSVPFLSVL